MLKKIYNQWLLENLLRDQLMLAKGCVRMWMKKLPCFKIRCFIKPIDRLDRT